MPLADYLEIMRKQAEKRHEGEGRLDYETIDKVASQKHRRNIETAFQSGKPISEKVQKDYPELSKPKTKAKRKVRPLPIDALHPTELPFDSMQYVCYVKPVQKGYRMYCRRQK